jgi:hypothetical protein
MARCSRAPEIADRYSPARPVATPYAQPKSSLAIILIFSGALRRQKYPISPQRLALICQSVFRSDKPPAPIVNASGASMETRSLDSSHADDSYLILEHRPSFTRNLAHDFLGAVPLMGGGLGESLRRRENTFFRLMQ